MIITTEIRHRALLIGPAQVCQLRRRRQERSRLHLARTRVRQSANRAWLAFAFEHSRCLSQVPSPAQSGSEVWLAPWCIRDLCITQVTSCIAACCGSALNDYSSSMQIV